MEEDYKYPLKLTQQFRFCGNPLSLDLYHFCSFGCKYCFARSMNGQQDFTYETSKIEYVEEYFKKAFEDKKEYKDIIVELLKHRVPIHIGGLADPFQPIEFQKHLTYKMIELSNKYNYPLIFSTKQSYLPDEYYKILNPEIHSFQISLIGVDEDFIRKYEDNTPSPTQRINFLKTLRQKGFWCSIRIQPCIDLQQALKLCDLIDGIASYITIEHLKIDITCESQKIIFEDLLKSGKYKSISTQKNFELERSEKIKDIVEIKKHLKKTLVGVGDNDLHFLSQSRCCCGLDTINENYNNYLKYNLTYIATMKEDEDLSKLYIPKCNISNCINNKSRIKNANFKDYVDEYCSRHTSFLGDNCDYARKNDGLFYNKKTGEKYQQATIFNLDNFGKDE